MCVICMCNIVCGICACLHVHLSTHWSIYKGQRKTTLYPWDRFLSEPEGFQEAQKPPISAHPRAKFTGTCVNLCHFLGGAGDPNLDSHAYSAVLLPTEQFLIHKIWTLFFRATSYSKRNSRRAELSCTPFLCHQSCLLWQATVIYYRVNKYFSTSYHHGTGPKQRELEQKGHLTLGVWNWPGQYSKTLSHKEFCFFAYVLNYISIIFFFNCLR